MTIDAEGTRKTREIAQLFGIIKTICLGADVELPGSGNGGSHVAIHIISHSFDLGSALTLVTD